MTYPNLSKSTYIELSHPGPLVSVFLEGGCPAQQLQQRRRRPTHGPRGRQAGSAGGGREGIRAWTSGILWPLAF